MLWGHRNISSTSKFTLVQYSQLKMIKINFDADKNVHEKVIKMLEPCAVVLS